MERALVAKHVIASSNLFLGTSNFIVLALPPEYGIGQTINPTEVNATHLARGAAWTVVDDQRNAQLLLHALGNQPHHDVGGAAGRKADQPSDRLHRVGIGGHDGVVLMDSFRTGFPRRREHARLRAWWSCERTKRSLVLEIAGPAPLVLSPLATALVASECH